jgi:hypothetical protein
MYQCNQTDYVVNSIRYYFRPMNGNVSQMKFTSYRYDFKCTLEDNGWYDTELDRNFVAPVCACSLFRGWGTWKMRLIARICLYQSPLLLKTCVCVLTSVHIFYFNLNSSSVINFHCTFKHFSTHNSMASSLKECHNIIHEFCE